MVTSDALAAALAVAGPFEVKYGVDYVLLEAQDGTTVESIVLAPTGATWGVQDEFTVSTDDARSLALSILYSQKDVV